MGKKIKKGTKGPVSKYITRSKAIKKLDIPIKDFRKLCILKGVHPREPSKGVKNQNTTYYHLKDIKYLAQDKLMEYFRQIKTYRRKLHLALKKQDKSKIQKLKENKPEMDLKHIIKERYSEFSEALRDMDDPLSLIALVAEFPSHRLFKINPEKVQICKTLLLMFKSVCVRQKFLKKVFLSVKGIYYQVQIQGIDITWVEPYPFGQTLPFDVDYKVILSFVEFYTVLLKFTIFKLCKEYDIEYPVEILKDLEGVQHNGNCDQYLNCLTKESQIKEEEFKTDVIQDRKEKKKIFENFKFFLSREVNKEIFEFCIKNFGGEVFYDHDNFNSEFFKENFFTHVIVDRPMDNVQRKANTEYVQPQWIIDSINFETLLPVTDYMPGKKLPPHLSPFDKSKSKGFITQREKEIMQMKGEYVEESIEDSEEEEMENTTKENVKKEVYNYEQEQKEKQKKLQEQNKEEQKLSEKMLTKQEEQKVDLEQQKQNERIEQMLQIPDIVDLDAQRFFLGNLIVCPTPLGNLKDLSIRSFEALQQADIILCEDTRLTGKLYKMLRVKNFEQNLQDLKEEDVEIDDKIFDQFVEKRKIEHKNFASIKREKKKAKDFAIQQSETEFIKISNKKLKEADSLSFMTKYDDEKEQENDNGDYYFNDEFLYDTSAKNRKKTKGVFGLDSDYITYIKEKVEQSKLKNKRGLFISCNRFQEENKIIEILRLLKAGFKVVLVSDAGSPCLSDPGYKLINSAIKNNILIHALPGPNAISISLMSSGFPADNFKFMGYLPKYDKELQLKIQQALDSDLTCVFFENKNRLLHTLIQLEKYYGQKQMIYIGVELTKMHERHLRGTINQVFEKLNKNPDYTIPSLQGEISIVIAPYNKYYNKDLQPKIQEQIKQTKKTQQAVDIQDAVKILNNMMELGTKDLSKIIAKIYQIKSKDAYQLVLKLKQHELKED